MAESGLQLISDEVCQVCWHTHTTPDWCSADDYAPGPDGDEWLGPCTCQENMNREAVSKLVLVPCSRAGCGTHDHMHAEAT
jgi:hypothetical protein